MSNSEGYNLRPRELQAMEEHKYFMSQQRGREVSIEEAIADFLACYAADWRREQMRRDAHDQVREIERHKYFRSREAGRDIGSNAAAFDWCEKYAPIWRAERESLERNGFVRAAVVVENPNGLHLRPTSELAELARRYDAEIYVHRPGMDYYNFRLEGRAFMNVKSILCVLSLGIRKGDRLEFIATGAQAAAVLAAVVHVVNAPSPAAGG